MRARVFLFFGLRMSPLYNFKNWNKNKMTNEKFYFYLVLPTLSVNSQNKKNRNFVYKTLCSQQMLKCKEGQINKQSSILIIHFFFNFNKYMYQSAVQVSSLYLKHFFKISLQHKKTIKSLFLLIIKGHDCQFLNVSYTPDSRQTILQSDLGYCEK